VSRISKIFLVRKDITPLCAFLTQREADDFCYEQNTLQRQDKSWTGPWIYYHWDELELKRPK
jgi:hypothetical protein